MSLSSFVNEEKILARLEQEKRQKEAEKRRYDNDNNKIVG